MTRRDLLQALRSLPSGLEETYERIRRAIDPHSSEGKIAMRALVWLVAALRPLQLVEILEALSIDLKGRKLDRSISPVHGPALLDVLGSLVVYHEETDAINLSHFTVKVSGKNAVYLSCCVLNYSAGVPCRIPQPRKSARIPY